MRAIPGIRTRHQTNENVGLQVKTNQRTMLLCLKTSAGFGFLASKEVKEAGVGNLGLQDRKPIKSSKHSAVLRTDHRTRGVTMDTEIYRCIWR